MSRVYSDKIDIDQNSIKLFYKQRAIDKVKIDVDSPVVLCGDNNKDNISLWTDFEIKNRLGLLDLTENANVLEIGCGTGRISKYIIDKSNMYVGIDYVKELIDIAKSRDDINKDKNVQFINTSFSDFITNDIKSIKNNKFNRFVISGGVLMYMNDTEVNLCLNNLIDYLDDESIIYISEPVAITKRLTLNKFYSENLESEYSAIYRTLDEYNKFFDIFYKAGFKLDVSEEFFYDDIKKQRETKQWIFVLSRSK